MRSDTEELILEMKVRRLSLALVLLICGYFFVIASVAAEQTHRILTSHHQYQKDYEPGCVQPSRMASFV